MSKPRPYIYWNGDPSRPIKGRFRNITGKKYGSLTAVHPVNKSAAGNLMWFCQCECGKSCERVANTLAKGLANSCGCQRLDGKRWLQYSELRRKPGITITHKFKEYREGASRRDIGFHLTRQEFEKLITENCHYCGCDPSSPYTYRYESVLLNGVDRRDNFFGYDAQNCVTCCATCNYAKRTMSDLEYIEHCKRVVAHSCK